MSDEFINNIELLIIDPQNDFHPLPASTLGVPGACDDAKRLAKLIRGMKNAIDDIHVTLDTHQLLAVFHPLYWVGKNGKHPDPFTGVTQETVEQGEWKAYISAFQPVALEYVTHLKRNGRYDLIIWPPHCLLGTWGHNVYEEIGKVLAEWELTYRARVDYVVKGHNLHTEHYSAVQADVPNDDPTTQLNTRLIETLQRSRKVWVAGQASSHCVANTGKDIADIFGVDSVQQLVFLSDCMSPVPGFEGLAEAFLKDMKTRGAEVTTSTQLLS